MAFQPIEFVPDSNIAGPVEYDDETKTLRIVFVRNNRTYEYSEIDAKTVEGFSTSGLTAGKYLNAYIKGRFPYAEV